MNEQRGFVRFKTPLYLKVTPINSSKEFSGAVEDISVGGARIISNVSADIVLGERVYLYLLFPADTIKILSAVVWLKNYANRRESGVRFLEITEEQKQNIFSHIFKYHREVIVQNWWQGIK